MSALENRSALPASKASTWLTYSATLAAFVDRTSWIRMIAFCSCSTIDSDWGTAKIFGIELMIPNWSAEGRLSNIWRNLMSPPSNRKCKTSSEISSIPAGVMLFVLWEKIVSYWFGLMYLGTSNLTTFRKLSAIFARNVLSGSKSRAEAIFCFSSKGIRREVATASILLFPPVSRSFTS